MSIDLMKLQEPFAAEDIEWRVSRAGVSGREKIYCRVLAYITARAIQERLDEVCGPENWALTQPIQLTHGQKSAIGVGISIRVSQEHIEGMRESEWVTRWDVAELTDGGDHIPPFKGGFSGAIKRAGAQWGIGRYLYHLDEAPAEVSDTDPAVKGWHYARLPKNAGGAVYYWREPTLPGWALPKEKEAEVKPEDLNALKKAWRAKFAADSTDTASLLEGFSRFVASVCGDFPSRDHKAWTKEALDRVYARIRETTEPGGISSDVPFGG